MNSPNTDSLTNVRRAIQNLAVANDVMVLRRVIISYPELLAPGLDTFLTRCLQNAWQHGDKAGTCIFLACRTFLSRCRNQGVETVLNIPLPLPLPRNSALSQLLLSTNRESNLLRRAKLARQALADVRRASEPDLWATLQRELADCLVQSAGPNKAEHLEEALDSYRAALDVWQTPSPKWAQTLHAMATAFRRRIKGKRPDNLQQALQLYQQALTIRTEEKYPVQWATTQHNLGTTWLEISTDDQAENVEKGIQCYKAALTVRTPKDYPDLWAAITNDLAIAYTKRLGGDRTTNLKEAIKQCQTVLMARSPVEHPLDWGRSQVTLGSIYVLQLQGGRAENLEQAIEYYRDALKVLLFETYPFDWAQAHYNLAITYRHRPTGDRVDNLEQAVEHYHQALKVYTPETYPMEWAHVQTGLGNTYCQPELESRAQNLEKAIACYQAALPVRTRNNDPAGWATIQNNLGNAYADRIMGSKSDNQEQAIACYELALLERTPQVAPARWAEVMNNLGAVYSERLHGNPHRNRKEAVQYFRQALTVHKPHTFPNDSRRAARNLANLIFFEGRWPEAHATYKTALEAAETLYSASFMETGREAEIGENAALYIHDAFCLAHLGRSQEALVRLEEGKTRILAERLERDAVQLQKAKPEDQKAYRDLVDRLKGLEAEQRTSDESESLTGAGRPYSKIAKDVKQTHQQLAVLVQRIHNYLPDFRPDPLDFAAIQALVSDKQTALVEFCVTGKGSMILVVRADGKPEVVWIKEFTHIHLQGIVDEWTAAYRSKNKAGWKKTIEQVLGQLGPKLVAPLCKTLNKKGITRLILIPQGSLFLLPLHAVPLGKNGACLLDHYEVSYAPSATVLQRCRERAISGPAQRFFAAANPTGDFAYAGKEVPTIESFFSRSETLWRDKATKDKLLTRCKGYDYVHFCCHGQYDWDDPFRSVLMLAGSYQRNKDGSYQQDEDGNPIVDYRHALTLTKVETDLDLKQTRLVTLPACETGLTEAIGPRAEEYVGLPAGFLLAGVPAVVAPLWAVYEVSTTLLMERFYENHLCGDPDDEPDTKQPLPAAEALRRAQLWLRDRVTVQETAIACKAQMKKLTDERKLVPDWLSRDWKEYARMARETPEYRIFAHPFFWAAFNLSGSAESFDNLKGNK